MTSKMTFILRSFEKKKFKKSILRDLKMITDSFLFKVFKKPLSSLLDRSKISNLETNAVLLQIFGN
jgi:hypothetical protein